MADKVELTNQDWDELMEAINEPKRQAAAREQAARGLRDLLKKAVAEAERRNPYSTRMFFGMHAEAERAISEFDKTWGQK